MNGTEVVKRLRLGNFPLLQSEFLGVLSETRIVEDGKSALKAGENAFI